LPPVAVDIAVGGTDEDGSGGLAHETSSAAMAIIRVRCLEGLDTLLAIQENVMFALLLEALGALLLLVFIVWWTMCSGRKKGELAREPTLPASESGSGKK